MKNRFLLLLLLTLGISATALAQEKCGTVAYDKIRRQTNSTLETTDQFEKWMRSKVSQLRLRTLSTGRVQTQTYTVPVVVHVINNGEAVGTGTNIPDSQIISQIAIINRDFPRLNPDTTNTLSQFKPVAGGIDLQFILAKQDPEGLATNGIVRVKGSKSGWLMSDNSSLKSQSYWPSEDYLNIWIVNFVDPNGIIGYAQLPVSGLAGLESSSNDPLTDGVVIDYRAFGLISNPVSGYTAYNLGRTATHEIGHIFGLRHIWGDDGAACTGSDYCDDTPNQGDSNNGNCQTAVVSDACSSSIMYQNYMDYTDDACMNLFSNDQVARMVVVLGNSPRRTSLLTSIGATDPTQVANDLGIKAVNNPGVFTCVNPGPSIVVRNYGSNAVTSAQIQLTLNGGIAETKNITFSPALSYLDSTTVVFSNVNLAGSSTNTFDFQVLLTNGVTDGKATNNSKSQTAVVPSQGSLPLFEPFNSTPAGWSIINPDGGITWANIVAPNASVSNTAMYMDFYDYDSEGEIDQLVTPTFDFSADTAAVLKFDFSHALFSSQDNDQLRVVVYTGCNFTNGVEIFNKSGTALATAASTSQSFAPAGSGDWKTQTISLSQFLGQPNVRIAFIATNAFGNNLYLDNIQIGIGNYDDVALVGLKNPGPVICTTNPVPIITVRNDGTTSITSLTIKTTIGSTQSTQSISPINLNTGAQQDFTLKPWTLADGTNNISISLVLSDDAVPTNNTINWIEVVNTSQNIIPIRENFDSPPYTDWTIVSQNQQMAWKGEFTNDKTKSISLVYDAYTNLNIGSQSWLVSPVLDFSNASKASVFFDRSYAQGASRGSERLQLLGSTDCGQTYPLIPYDSTGAIFKKSTTSSSWSPQAPSDWGKSYASLDQLVGNKQVRLAFLVTNANGNNLYLDNVEIFMDDNQNPATQDPGNPWLNPDHLVFYNSDRTDPRIVFDLTEKETVRVQIFSTMGQVVSDEELPNTLNQTYHFDLNGKPGIYVVRIQIGNQLSTTKLFIPN